MAPQIAEVSILTNRAFARNVKRTGHGLRHTAEKVRLMTSPSASSCSPTLGWEYDLQGRVVKEVRADGKVTSYSYEPTTSRLKTRTDRRGVVTTYDYHKDNQLERLTYPNVQGSVAPMNKVIFDANPDK